jgi:hypothetical protein
MTENSFPVHDDYSDEPDELNEHIQEPADPDGLVAAEKWRRLQERHVQELQERHPVPGSTPPAAYKRKRAWPKVLIVVLVVVAAAYGAYWFGNHEATQKTDKKAQTAASQSPKQSTQAATTATKQYTSTNYSLSFNYPANWTVNDTTAKLTVTSPAMQLAIPTGAKTSVHVTIQNPQTSIPGFPSGGAVAALQSNLLMYAQPSSVQRAQTYVSYLSYTASNGLDAVYVTGNNGYQQGQVVPLSDIIQGNPLISVAFESCTDASCTNGKPVTLSASDWQSSAADKQVMSLLESLVVQG